MGAILGTATGVLVFAFINITLRKRTAGKTIPAEGRTEEPAYLSNLAGN
jgi:hypothetical protein